LFQGIGGRTTLNLPGRAEEKYPGNMTEVTRLLNLLGYEGWQLVTSSSGEATMTIWTLQRVLA
jgi:hypothetical protein